MPKKIRKFKFEKLARDEIVQGIIGAGNKPTLRTLMTDEYIEELKKKILEEAMELNKAKEKEEILEELADIEEVTENILRAFGLRKYEILKIQRKKNAKRGSFKKRHYVEKVEVEDGNEWLDYYLSNPDKYPEIK
ncbi:hypothetical protein A2962_03305 [Candidatus Woesebacteria bacterium RIFCSPLOWO2_01_FULL_39_61]|uniref:Phosphoribosyl-ATP pyrophosphohydrolase n=1 Tax=Candidatus Woesebacteria bacterium RIFCSPHIGHO2_02_FULL_39_13 TaxID=1802505 RepID=A0A1F7Z2R8_9BACT|nr:MAG: hypothetical protein A2692_04390 [Candidatus Woesebacteria bacterium RIFCSPHIGHO2_01_FULL_39_95]OGM33882.1 MAG: hypothetical protein A3D01_02675 [Candidatus Woesebacteria bacterium RIFCSPHIGHO2_02_FULL_39_13]OGM39042.1 MAG: hypothetical protein A3E13_04945 [Candidatus Woesebacteria bacterium RIFCSPHIGHO2_12_FULL_40_20]OGM67545.1 MAG: hypothetical protein A2962_03305 [Candidatus Woesebacteria bacterium RIFCSPLOWO2_01_FULL_39_61]OGM72862.1 MAG: hypothetical protein A3H19_05810 [Candidatus